MVYLTGDCHGEFSRLSSKAFAAQKTMTREDFVLICGDFGGIWHEDAQERYWLKWLEKKPFTLLFIDGNHENYNRLYGDEFKVVDFHGGKAHKIRENIYHLMRGYVFDLCGKKFFAFGGASCHDIDHGILKREEFATQRLFQNTCKRMSRQGLRFRVEHESWWRQELPDEAEMARGLQSLAHHENRVDYVISHCLPQSIYSNGVEDVLTAYFDRLLDQGLTFERWFCGHYHRDHAITERFQILYRDVLRIV